MSNFKNKCCIKDQIAKSVLLQNFVVCMRGEQDKEN